MSMSHQFLLSHLFPPSLSIYAKSFNYSKLQENVEKIFKKMKMYTLACNFRERLKTKNQRMEMLSWEIKESHEILWNISFIRQCKLRSEFPKWAWLRNSSSETLPLVTNLGKSAWNLRKSLEKESFVPRYTNSILKPFWFEEIRSIRKPALSHLLGI